jgi:DNA-binding CsgD family transcriptional regulator
MTIEELKEIMLKKYRDTYPFNIIIKGVYKDNLDELNILDINPVGVLEVLDTITDREREIVDYLYNKGLRTSKISEILNISKGTVGATHSKILKKLRHPARKNLYLYSSMVNSIESLKDENYNLCKHIVYLKEEIKNICITVDYRLKSLINREVSDE